MSLKEVNCGSNALFVIGAHALSTEDEEVMGLLLGKLDYDKRNGIAERANIFKVLPLSRTDKRADRVEVDSSQLAIASEEAEADGLTVVGWYHSHPHITAAPSHVDAQTQGQYQALDSGFVGLICAAFQGDRHDLPPSLKVIAFQSDDTTNQPGGIFSASSSNANSQRGSEEPPSYNDLISTTRGATTIRRLWRSREIPLNLTGDFHQSTSSSSSLKALAKLQDALLQEETQSFSFYVNDITFSATSSRIFCNAVFQQSLALLTVDSLTPLLHVAAAKLIAAKKRVQDLKSKRDSLLLLLRQQQQTVSEHKE
uniref:MPN domain-containing protein n=1 Tax=Aureoumbra lagunensis TaxID=44058 RepID=A0A7S3NGQ4_9STRA